MALLDQMTQPQVENLEPVDDQSQEGVNLERKAPGYGYSWKIKLHTASYPTFDDLLDELRKINRRLENDYGDLNLVKPVSRKG